MWKLGKRTDYRGTMKFDYNTEEQLTAIFNEKRERHYFELDKVGNVIEETNFAEKVRRYKRDLAGRVIEETLPSGKQRAYNYDKMERQQRGCILQAVCTLLEFCLPYQC